MKKLLSSFGILVLVVCCVLTLLFSCNSKDEGCFNPAPLPDTTPVSFCGEYVKDVNELPGLAYLDKKRGLWFIETDEKAYYYICIMGKSFLDSWNPEMNYKVEFSGKVYQIKKGLKKIDDLVELLPPGITPYALDANDVKVTVIKTFTN